MSLIDAGCPCRFCSRNATKYVILNFNGKKVSVVICDKCIKLMDVFSIYRCSYCGNIWMGVKDQEQTLDDCTICRGGK